MTLRKLIQRALLFAFVIGSTATASAQTPTKPYGLDFGVGLFSDYGVLGFGGRYFIRDFWDLHAAVGADITGTITSFGTRFYTSPVDDVCYFTFICEPRLFLGAGLLTKAASKGTVHTSGSSEDFNLSSGYAASITGGWYDVFPNGFTMGGEIGYRFWTQRPTATFRSGLADDEKIESVKSLLRDSFSVALTFGWKFDL